MVKFRQGVGKFRDESNRNSDLLELEVMDQQSQGMLKHLSSLTIIWLIRCTPIQAKD
jgi:hypothetical protein